MVFYMNEVGFKDRFFSKIRINLMILYEPMGFQEK